MSRSGWMAVSLIFFVGSKDIHGIGKYQSLVARGQQPPIMSRHLHIASIQIWYLDVKEA
jgi:hypothetical protein